MITGPTASGKSGLALALARRLEGTVINADAMQVYRELAILTARPGAEALAQAPHRLYGVLPAAQSCSAGLWRSLAVDEIARSAAAGRLPILVGGTGLYLRALLDGLARVPSIPEAVRAAARWRHAELGGPAFHRDLAARDPVMAARLRPQDSQRLIRAWEVLQATGRSLAEWQAETGEQEPAPAYAVFRILVIPPRPALYAACDRRFREMAAAGALDEVRALLALGLDPGLPAMKALGVRELAAYLAGSDSLEAAVAAGQQATRRYAKRQLTWLRAQIPGNNTTRTLVVEQFSETIVNDIFNKIRPFLLTPQG